MTDGFNWGEQRKNATTILTGDFPVIFAAAESKKSSNGKPQISYTLKITSGPYVGRTIKGQITFSPENPVALKMFFQQMDSLGFGEAFFAQLQAENLSVEEAFNRIASGLQGKQLTAELENKPWNGMDREVVKTFKNSGAATGFTTSAAVAVPVALPAAVEAAPSGPPADPF